ncbi:serine/threonine-protein kinase [Streptomyces formicae]|uniref:non-specific serine/threonine protein kinase n=1 Tax=Streptomyces formicae TaxID=1616117 RepID=A0ABY3WE22_9ACTN|nr:serine/threonine-protein kinase [Streptomyces formicae]UNM10816.1 serine/threonine protein kinase [Streptomyces formicae]
MTNDGGRAAHEPTSYALQPPQQRHVPQQNGAAPPPAQDAPQAAHAPQAPQSTDGRVIGGRYRLVARLGHGGMGTVWRAHDEIVDRDVAIKEPRVPDHLGERDRANVYLRMQREARAAARISHPSVVTMHDVVMEDGKPWIVMELVRGQSLGDRLQEGTLDVREAARIGLAVLGALTAAHEAGVLHRDVKPDNVLLGRGDRVVLTDFGIAQVEGEQGLTETGAFVGSPEFIAPERVLGQRPGPESDLWSLGVVLYAAVEGMSPYRRSHTPATLQAVLSAEPQMPARGSGAFGTLVMQLLRKDPAARPGAAEIRATLEAVAHPPQPSAAATRLYAGAGAGPAGSRWVPPVLHRNRPAQFGLLGGVLAVALALVLIVVKPFGGAGLPEGWQVRPESEILSADVAVPSEYERSEGDSGDSVTYRDPSGVFGIYLEHVQITEDNADDVLKPDKDAWDQYYAKGGENGMDYKEPDVGTRDVTHQEKPAFETTVDYVPYSSTGDDPIRYRLHELVVPGKDKAREYWRLQVSMPAEGAARTDGEVIFTNVLKHLKIQGL